MILRLLDIRIMFAILLTTLLLYTAVSLNAQSVILGGTSFGGTKQFAGQACLVKKVGLDVRELNFNAGTVSCLEAKGSGGKPVYSLSTGLWQKVGTLGPATVYGLTTGGVAVGSVAVSGLFQGGLCADYPIRPRLSVLGCASGLKAPVVEKSWEPIIGLGVKYRFGD